jgi:hypothetical protein
MALGVTIHRQVNLRSPKLSTLPVSLPPSAETTPFRMVMKSAIVWDPAWPPPVGHLTKRL